MADSLLVVKLWVFKRTIKLSLAVLARKFRLENVQGGILIVRAELLPVLECYGHAVCKNGTKNVRETRQLMQLCKWDQESLVV